MYAVTECVLSCFTHTAFYSLSTQSSGKERYKVNFLKAREQQHKKRFMEGSIIALENSQLLRKYLYYKIVEKNIGYVSKNL